MLKTILIVREAGKTCKKKERKQGARMYYIAYYVVLLASIDIDRYSNEKVNLPTQRQ